MKIEIYTKDNCPFCEMAKMLLTHKAVNFEEINYGSDADKIADLVKKSGMKTMPQIFIEDELIGGYDDLRLLDESGKLDKILNEDSE